MNSKAIIELIQLKFLGKIFILIVFIYLLVFPISNYTILILEFKGIIALLSILIFYFLIKKNNTKIILSFKGNELITFIFFIFISISLLWSSNQTYGSLKLIHFIFQLIPFYILFKSVQLGIINKNDLKLLLNFIIFISLSLSIYIILTKPFIFENYNIIYRKFSHVYPARIINLSIILTCLFQNLGKFSRFKLLSLTLILLIQLFSLSLTAHRASILATLICLFLILVLTYRKSITRVKIIYVTLLLFFIFSLSVSENFLNRIESRNLSEIVNKDITILSRIKMIKLSFDLWRQNKLFGTGLGGFYSEISKKVIGSEILYPHNLFLEVLTETGIIGLLIVLFLILKSLKSIYQDKYRMQLFILWLYFFIHSLTSKDLTINFPVYLFFYITFIRNENLLLKFKRLHKYSIK